MHITIALLAAAISLTSATPHANHAHKHLHIPKRDATDVAIVPGPTIIAYVLNGSPISEEDVQQGIANGTLVWADGGLKHHKPAHHHAPPPPAPSPESSAAPTYSKPAPTSSAEPAPTYSSAPPPPSSGGDNGDDGR